MENIAEVEAYIANTRVSITQYKQELDAIRSLDRPVTKNDPFVISFVGKFKTGKSSLIKSFPDRRTIENSDLCANSPKKL